MAKNKELEDIVLIQMYKHLSRTDKKLKFVTEDNEILGKEIIKSTAIIDIDKEYKIRANLNRILVYGYDFKKTDSKGTPAKEIYENKINIVKKISGGPNIEKFVSEGIVDNRYCWYITSIK